MHLFSLIDFSQSLPQCLDICKSHLVEAKWYHEGYKRSLHEYIDNAIISVGGPLVPLHAYILSSSHITTEVVQYLEKELPNIIRCSTMVFRLVNDFGTSSVRTIYPLIFFLLQETMI